MKYETERKSYLTIMQELMENTFCSTERIDRIESGIRHALERGESNCIITIAVESHLTSYVWDYSFVREMRKYFNKRNLLTKFFDINWLDKQKAGPVVIQFLDNILLIETKNLVKDCLSNSLAFSRFINLLEEKGFETNIIYEDFAAFIEINVT